MSPSARPSLSTSPPDLAGAPSITRFLLAGLLLGALWFALVGPEAAASWVVGLPTVVASAWSFTRLSRGNALRLSLVSAALLIPVFVWESFRGGIDVARRVLRPRLDLDPGLVDYRLRLTTTSARVFFVGFVSLLPGTLSADLQGDTLRIHALDLGADPLPELLRLEWRVAAIFRDTFPSGSGAAP